MNKLFLAALGFVFFLSMPCAAQKTSSGADVKVLRAQASDGDISAAVQLAKHYMDKKDVKKAEEWFAVSAQAGDAEAQYFLARIYDESREGRHPNKEVAEWLEKSAGQGYVDAQVALAKIHQFGRRGIPKDLVKAKNWYDMAAAKGSKEAMLQLEKIYQSSKDRYSEALLKDENLAWLDAAANQGDAEASLSLAVRLERGIGVPRDLNRAFRLYRAAAEAGIPQAQSSLGSMYANGSGVAANDETAVLWLERAAVQGYVEAQRKLAEIYTLKKPDKVKAYGWLVVSLSAMFPDQPDLVRVSPDLERLMRSMTADQIASGQAYALSLVNKLKASREEQEQKQRRQMEELKKWQAD